MSKNHARLHAGRWATFAAGYLIATGGGAGNAAAQEDSNAITYIPTRKRLDPYDLGNLQTLCRTCHVEKTARENTQDDPERRAWRAFIASL